MEATFEERTSKLLRSLPPPKLYTYIGVIRVSSGVSLLPASSTLTRHHFPVCNFPHACFINDNIRFLFILTLSMEILSFDRLSINDPVTILVDRGFSRERILVTSSLSSIFQTRHDEILSSELSSYSYSINYNVVKCRYMNDIWCFLVAEIDTIYIYREISQRRGA